MTAADALKTARNAGIDLSVDGEDLVLEASAPPSADILALLSHHKAGILAMLRPSPDGWSVEDWQAFQLERAAIAEFDGGLAPAEAALRAFDCCVAEWLNRNPQYASAAHCFFCGRVDHAGAPTLPVSIAGTGQVWLHSSCASGWAVRRKSEAVSALAAMGIERTSAAADRGSGTSQSRPDVNLPLDSDQPASEVASLLALKLKGPVLR